MPPRQAGGQPLHPIYALGISTGTLIVVRRDEIEYKGYERRTRDGFWSGPLPKPTFRQAVYYFDLAAWSIALLIAIGFLAATSQGVATTWHWRDRVALGGFGIIFAALCILRRRAYTQNAPWLTAGFSGSAIVALVIVFWRSDTLWFILVLSTSLAVLVVAAVARAKTISQPLSRYELFTLLWISGNALFGLILLEVLLRLGSGLFTPEIQQLMRINPGNYGVAHPYIGHLHTPNSSFVVSGRDFTAVHHVDALGFRNAWPWPRAPIDIVVVGDSVAFGYGVPDEKTWPALLARSRPGTRLVNLALVGAGPQQYSRVFETFGTKLRPKLLLVGVWAANDFGDAITFQRWQQSGAGGNDMVWRDFGSRERVTFNPWHPLSTLGGLSRQGLYPWLRRSYLYNLLWAIRGGWDRNSVRATITFPFRDGSRLQLRPSDLHEASAAALPGRREFQLLLEALAELHSIAADQHVHVLMVLQPGKEEVYLPLLEHSKADPTSALREAFDARGIQYLDLAPAFRERAAAGERLYREVDGHPNEAGYALISQLILSHLKQHEGEYGLDRQE